MSTQVLVSCCTWPSADDVCYLESFQSCEYFVCRVNKLELYMHSISMSKCFNPLDIEFRLSKLETHEDSVVEVNVRREI